METSGWVSVRCVLRSVWDGVQHYEERITLWRAPTMDAAIERAEADARSHADEVSNPPEWITAYLGFAQAYLLADDLGDGAEVFSLMRDSEADPDSYLARFFDTGVERQQTC